MLKNFQKIIGKSLCMMLTGILLLTTVNPANAKIIFKNEFLIEDNGSDTFIIDSQDDVTGAIKLQFGGALAQTISYDNTNTWFEFSDDVNLNLNEIKNFAIDNLALEPLTGVEGQVYYNTSTKLIYMYDGVQWTDLVAGTEGDDDLDSVYQYDTDKIMNVNDALGLEFNSTVSSDIIFDLQGTGDVAFQDAGVDFATFTDTGEFNIDNLQLDGETIKFGAGLSESLEWDSINSRFELSDALLIDGDNSVIGQIYVADDHTAVDSDATLNIGRVDSTWATLNFDSIEEQFEVNQNFSLQQNEIKDLVIDHLATAPVAPLEGQVYYNTTDEQIFMYTSTGWEPMGYHALTHINGEDDIPLATTTTKGLMAPEQVEKLDELAVQSNEINRNTINNNLVLGENVVSGVAYLTYENPEGIEFTANIENVEFIIPNNTSPGIALTGGTDTFPTLNYVYVKDTGVVEASTTNPATQSFGYVPIAEVLVGNVNTSDATYYYIENLTNFIRNFIRDVNRRLRLDQTLWLTGTELTTSGINVAVSSGTVMHIHEEIFYPAKNTATGDTMIDQYFNIFYGLDNNFYDDGAGGNDSIGNNKFHKIFIWGDIYGGLHMERQLKPPTSEYTSLDQAAEDPDDVATNGVPVQWATVGFPIAHVILNSTSGVQDIVDLRGNTGGGGGGGASVHVQNTDIGSTSPVFTLDSDNSSTGINIDIIANQGSDLDGVIRYNTTTNQWEISNNGGSFNPIATEAAGGIKHLPMDLLGAVMDSVRIGTVNSGTSPVLRFDGSDESSALWSFGLPSDWLTGSNVIVEIYWSAENSGTGNVYFELDYQSWGEGEIISGTSTLNSTEATAATELELSKFEFTIPGSTFASEDMINIKINRDPSNIADTYADDINIHMIQIGFTSG